jgi:hypothetical protein
MKKISYKVAAVLLAGTFVCSSCIGSFSLFNKYEKWQCSMTSSKIVNGIVGLILQPVVGGVCLFVDAVVLNTIEFWTGDNPLAVGTSTKVMGEDGRYYTVTVTKDGYLVTSPGGQETRFTHNKQNESWSMTQDGVTKEIFRFNADGTIETVLQNGKKVTITNDQAGLQQLKQEMADSSFMAIR